MTWNAGAWTGRADPWLAGASVGMLGSGLFLVIAALFTNDIVWAGIGGAMASVSLLLLFSTGWVSALPVLAVSLALPPAYASESIRLGPALLVTGLVIAAWILARGIEHRSISFGGLPMSWLALFLMALAMSSGFATDRGSAVRETVTLVLLFAFLIVATDTLSRRPGSVTTVARVLGWVAAAAGGFAVLESVGVLPGEFAVAGTPYFRATGGFAWPNELAMYLAISLPFTVMLVREASGSLGRVVAMLALGLAMAGLVSTFSRGSWLATVVAPGVLLFVSERGFVFRVWLVAAAVVLVLDLATGGAVSGRIAETLTDPLVGQRFVLTQAGVLMFLAHPLVGVGPGGFEAGLDEFGLLVPGLWDFVGSAHNAYVHIAAETGILGVVALVGLLFSTLWTLFRTVRDWLDASGEEQGRLLRVTVFWSFAVACTIAFAEWTFAQGIGQLIMLVAAMGFALARERAA